MNLYEISKSVDLIVQEVVDAEGELSEDLEKRLNEISMTFKDKSSNIAKWCLNIDGNVEAIDQEIARLAHRKLVQTNLQKRLKDYLKFCMENAGLHKLDLGTFEIAIHKNPPSVTIDDENKIPSKYINVIQISNINKSALLKDMKQGETIEGAHLETQKTHLEIK